MSPPQKLKPKPKPRRIAGSLGGRLLIGAAVGVTLALAVTGVAMGLALRHFIQAQVDGRLDGQIVAVADALRPVPGGGLRLAHEVDGPPFDRPLSGWYWEVLAPDPVLRSRSLGDRTFALGDRQPMPPPPRGRGPAPGPPDPPEPPGPPPETAEGRGPGDAPLRVRLRDVPLGAQDVTIAVAAPLEALDHPLRDAMQPLAVTLALLAVILVGGGALQVRLGLRPLRRLRAELAAVRTGRAERIEGPQPSEIRPLVHELNSLLDQHDANLERARRHVANLAHSLKTPLATLALALDEPPAPERMRPLVSGMDRMIRHHLARARAAALGGTSRARVALAPRVEDHRAAFGRLYADKALAFSLDVPADLVVACEAQDLDEILGNLIDNACQWARGRVAVRATEAGATVRLTIEDDGPGLATAASADVLQPGKRLDESAPGYGFGLPIARELTELYGGEIVLGRGDLGGLRVEVVLPRAM